MDELKNKESEQSPNTVKNNGPVDFTVEVSPDMQPSAEKKNAAFFKKIISFAKTHKAICITAIASLIAVILTIVMIVAFIPTATDKLLKAADSGYTDGLGMFAYLEEAKDVYSRPQELAKLEKAVKKRVDKIYNDLLKGKITYETACSKFDSYAYLPKNDSDTDKYVQGLREKLDVLNKSMLAYKSAMDLEKNGNINGALLKYAEVVEDDNSYDDAQSRIAKLSNDFVEGLQKLNEQKDYRSIILQGYNLSKNLHINENARNTISDLVKSAQSTLKESTGKELTVDVKEYDTGGTYTTVTTKTFETNSNDGIKVKVYAGTVLKEKEDVFGIYISSFAKDYLTFYKVMFGSTSNNLQGDADIDTEYAGYNKYFVEGGTDAEYMQSGTAGNFSWDEAKKLYDILTGSEQNYIKLYSDYSSNSLTFPISAELNKAILTLLDYYLSILGETTSTVS